MKKVLKLLTFLLLLIVAVEVRAEDLPKPVETTYIDVYGVENTVESIPLTGYETSLGIAQQGTWYVAESDIIFEHGISINGIVQLILADGIEMTVNGGEEAAGFNIENNSFFVVFSQSLGDNMGQLTVSGLPGIQQGGFGVLFFGGKVSVSGIVNSLDNAQVGLSGGQISVNNIDGGKVIIGHNSPYDCVWLFDTQNCTVQTDGGKCFVSDEGELISGNDISEELYSGHKLIPCYTLSLPEDFEITNDVKLIEGKYVAARTEIQFELKSGSTIDGEVRMNGEVITADGNGVYTAKATADLVIDVTKSTSVEYIDENGEPRTTDAIILTETTGIYSGWYVVNEDITFDHTLNFFGDVHIILANGKTMTVTPGENSTGLFGSANSTLSIYGQPVQAEEQPGTLTIKDCWAGISGEASNANININGGNVDIKCKMAALQGIQNGNSIVVNGGEINLESQEYAAIEANTCSINGGKVKATTKADGYHAILAKNITLGCTKSDDYIEASSYQAINSFSIAEGQILTDGEGNYYSGTLTPEQVEALAGKNLTRATDVVYFSLPGCMKITNGVTLLGGKYVAPGTKVEFDVKSGFALDGGVQMNGDDIQKDGDVYSVTATYDITITATASVAYVDENGDDAYKESGEYTILTGSETSLEAGWYVAASTITFDHQINVKGDVNIILADGATMTVTPGEDSDGLFGSANSTLSIYGQPVLSEEQPGTLTIKDCSAGIMGEASNANININGGNVDIQCEMAALWGNADGNSIVINGGEVSLESQEYAAIEANTCSINGGKVKATTKADGYHAILAKNITLGCTKSDDYIEASSYQAINSFSIAEGQILTDGEGNYYSGTLTPEQVEALAGKNLTRATDVVYFSLPGCMEITNGVTLLGGKYVAAGTEVEFKLKAGLTLDGAVQKNGTDIEASNDVYTVTASEDITITATASFAYIDEDGHKAYKEYGECTILTGNETSLEAGWYVAASPITFDHTITLNGNVNLILADDATMTVNPNDEKGINYADEYHFAIYGQKFQSGILEIKNCDGGFYGYGVFILNGGNILMTDGIGGYGIYSERSITINRGTVNIQSQQLSLNSWGDIEINGGEVTLGSQEYSAIEADNNCTINGGKVKATTKSEYDPAISAKGNITLGCTKSDDYIEASSYAEYATISIANGQVLTDGNGNLYFSRLKETQIAELANSHLSLAYNHSVVIPDCMEIVEYVAEEPKIKIAFRFGSELKCAVTLDDGTPLTSEDGVYSVIVDQDIKIKAETNIEISTEEELRALSDAVNKGYDFSGMTVTLTKDIEFETSEMEDNNFTAIGSYYGGSFNGTFDGGGHTISGIRIHHSEMDCQGFFGLIDEKAVVQNLVLANIEVTGQYYVGSIVGDNRGTVKNCLVIDATISGKDCCSGIIVGSNYDGTLTNNYNYNCKVNGEAIDNNIYKLTLATGVTASPKGNVVYFKSGDEYYCVEGSKIDLLSAPNPLYENVDFVASVDGIINDENTLTMPAKDVEVSAVADEIIINEGALKIIKNQSGTTAILDGAYTGADGFTIDEAITVDNVTFSRAFTNGATSTIMLPFAITKENGFTGGKFYELTSFDTEKGHIVANASEVEEVEANKPYIFRPDGNTFTITGEVTLEPLKEGGTSVSVPYDGWTFTGVYERKRWGADAGDNKDYCFAANETDDGIHIGDFVKIGTYVQLKPFRCYLTYDDGGISKATPILPESIKVRIVDVIDEPSDVVDEHNDDFETPVSEIVPAANVKVWSYDKTIYISAAAGTDYRIIDANGRALASGITATDRDEIRLGNRSGIVIVIINGKSFKVNY